MLVVSTILVKHEEYERNFHTRTIFIAKARKVFKKKKQLLCLLESVATITTVY